MMHVTVPASSANLGSGFDAAAVALELRMQARARRGDGSLRLRFTGREQPTHNGLAERVVAGMRLVVDEPSLLDVEIEIENDIPLGAGLGSSAAALVCGVVIAAHAAGRDLSKHSILELVAQAEGHADNAAAALYGGLCFALSQEQDVQVLALPFPAALQCAVVIPSAPLDTNTARGALPEMYPRAAVALSLQRATMLAASLASGHLDHLFAAMQDAIHQPYRSALYPGLRDALTPSDPAVCAVLSGAGPSVLLLSKKDPSTAAERAVACFERAGISARVQRASVAHTGLTLEGSLDEAAVFAAPGHV